MFVIPKIAFIRMIFVVKYFQYSHISLKHTQKFKMFYYHQNTFIKMYETFIYILGTNFPVNKINRHSSKNFSSLSLTHREKKFYIIVINRRKLIK